MVCSAEQSRINGRKSKGAVTVKGKAIAAQNARKHGLLATKPPLLASEDLETFNGIMQGLIERYSPSEPLEWHLIQVVAMAMLKQHRVWAAEASLVHQQTTSPPELELPYSYLKKETEENIDINSEYHPENLATEKSLLVRTLEFLETYEDLDSLIQEMMRREPEEDEIEEDDGEFTEEEAEAEVAHDWKNQLTPLLKRLKTLRTNPFKALKENQIFHTQDEYWSQWRQLRIELRDKRQEHWIAIADVETFMAIAKSITRHDIEWKTAQLKTAFKERLIQIEEIELANKEALDKHQEELQKYKQAVSGSNLISPNLELLMRYESHNSRQLMEASAKLEEYQATKNQ